MSEYLLKINKSVVNETPLSPGDESRPLGPQWSENIEIQPHLEVENETMQLVFLSLTPDLDQSLVLAAAPGQGGKPYPAVLKVKAPSPLPATPGEKFTPPSPQTTGINTPEIAEWTRTAGPDESIVLTGLHFTPDTRFQVYAHDVVKDAKVVQLFPDRAVITLPKSLPRWSMYWIWPVNKSGYGLPIAVNKTDAWWLGPDKANTKQVVSVFGCNLAEQNGTGALKAYIYITGPAIKGQWAQVTKLNPYKIDFEVPANLSPGEYDVWAFNGHGGNFGWAAPLKLTVAGAPPKSAKEFNVKDFGASPTASPENNSAAIKKAIEKAKSTTGATVVFPAGTFLMHDYLPATNDLTFRGAGKGKTILKCAPNFSALAQGLLSGRVRNFTIQDLTLDTNKNFRGALEKPIFLRGSQEVRLNNVGLSCAGYDIMDLHDCRYIYLTGCEIIGRGSFLGNGSQLFFDKNDFRLTNDTDMALHTWGGVGISLTRNTCQDLDNSDPDSGAGWGKGRFFTGSGTWGTCRNTYLGENITTDLTVRPQHNPIWHGKDADQNSGEQFLWEGGVAKWAGYALKATENTLTLADYKKDAPNAHYAIISKGKGFGQSRRITANQNGTVTLHEPWRVIPDTSSFILIGDYHDRLIIYGNILDGKLRAANNEAHTASAGIEPYGGVFNLIAANNTMQSLRQGIANFGMQHQVGHDPNFFHLYVNNKFKGCRWGIQNWANPNAGQKVTSEGPYLFGMVYRHNVAQNSVVADVINLVPKTGEPVLDLMVYEHNNLNAEPAKVAGVGVEVFHENQK